MDESAIRITRRMVTYMVEKAEQATATSTGMKPFDCPNCGKRTGIVDVDINFEKAMAFFQGLGLALAVCFEETTGSSARDKKPKDLMEWALELPDVRYPRVTL